MVIQFDKGRPDIAITCLADTKAEIDIVECDLEVDLIQTSTFLINFLAYDHASCGHRRETLSETRPAAIAWISTWKVLVRVSGNAANTQYNPAVLKSSVRIPEPRPDSTNARLRCDTNHLR